MAKIKRKQRVQQQTLPGAIAQLALIGFLTSVLMLVLGFVYWAAVIREQGFPAVSILFFQWIVLLLASIGILVTRDGKPWTHWFAFLVLSGLLGVTTLATMYLGRNDDQKRLSKMDDDELFLGTVDNYVKAATNCLTLFEKVTDKTSAEEAVYLLTKELSSLGGYRSRFCLAR